MRMGGALAEDGYPLVLQPEDIEAVAAERPEFNNLIERKVIEDMTPDWQQLEIDIINAGDDLEQLQLLRKHQATLEYRASRIKFWSAVALLHPFAENAVQERMDSKWGYKGYDLDTRVDVLMRLEESHSKLVAERRELSQGYLDSLERDTAGEPLAAEYVSARRNQAVENEIWIKRVAEILTDVCYGRLTKLDMSELEAGPAEEIELSPEQMAIANLPGLDPVKLIFAGERQKIPESGWLLDIYVKPGESGKIIIYQYAKNGFRVNYANLSRRFGEFSLGIGLDSSRSNSGEIKIRSEKENDEHYSVYCEKFDDRPNMEVIYPFLPSRAYPYHESLIYTSHPTVSSSDVIKAVQNNAGGNRSLTVARIVTTGEHAKKIIDAVTKVIGVSFEGRAKLIADLKAKDYFGELRTITPEEQKV